MSEHLTSTPRPFYEHFPVLRQEAARVEQPDPKNTETVAAVAQLFDTDFVENDISLAMRKVGDQIAERISAAPYGETRELLIEFGVQIVPFLEELYPDIASENPDELTGRLAHTLVYAQNRLQESQTSRGRLMTLGQRQNMLFEFSDRLTNT